MREWRKMLRITWAAPRWAIQFSASTSSGWPKALNTRCTVSISFTPNTGAGETMMAEGWSSSSCCSSLSASQSSRPEGRLRLISLRQRRVRVSSTTSAGVVGSTYCQRLKAIRRSISRSRAGLSRWLSAVALAVSASTCVSTSPKASGSLPQPWQSM
ncbi:hypothetical protein D9M73_220710 [compost metagenome]